MIHYSVDEQCVYRPLVLGTESIMACLLQFAVQFGVRKPSAVNHSIFAECQHNRNIIGCPWRKTSKIPERTVRDVKNRLMSLPSKFLYNGVSRSTWKWAVKEEITLPLLCIATSHELLCKTIFGRKLTLWLQIYWRQSSVTLSLMLITLNTCWDIDMGTPPFSPFSYTKVCP